MRRHNILGLNKRAQIPQTLTWFIATLVILGMLVISILCSSALAKSKQINGNEARDAQTELGRESSILETKTSLANELNNANKEKIEDILEHNLI